MSSKLAYQDFIQSKIDLSEDTGISLYPEMINKLLKPHQCDSVLWAAKGGCRAIFASFGLGKTIIQLELANLFVREVITDKKQGTKALITMPLGVKQEFKNDAKLLGLEIEYVRNMQEVIDCDKDIMITNYERVRDGDIIPGYFTYCSLDEASVLRNLGSKTYLEFVPKFRDVKYKTIATATPAPNDYIELLNYANFLGIMDVSQAKTRFFKRNSQKADNLTLLPNMEKEFWLWVSSWAMFLQKPSDLGYSDEGYDLPKLNVHWHRVTIDRKTNWVSKTGQVEMVAETKNDLMLSAKEKRETIDQRLDKAMEIIGDDDAHWIIWHHLEPERKAIAKHIDCESVYGSQKMEVKEDLITRFSNGEISRLSTKPSIAGQGCNFQRYCHKALYLGIDDKFNDLIQSIHRLYRFLQEHDVDIHLIYTDAEEAKKHNLLRKWKQHDTLVAQMTGIIKKFGLNNKNKIEQLKRDLTIERLHHQGNGYELIRNDAFLELHRWKENSVHMHLSSWPFAIQYEYSANYHDLGHNKSNEAFFKQMDWIIPELYRTLMPGRIAAIHTKERILFGNFTGLGFPTVYEFPDEVVRAMKKHGFAYCGRITIPTDVVRENAQTYRLGWSENAKDSTKMGVGRAEYVLLFRKPQTNRLKGYADLPVTKDKEEYTRARWQIDAHGHWNTNGNRLLTPAELGKMNLKGAMHRFKVQSANSQYDYEKHVELCEIFEEKGQLPKKYMAFPPVTQNDSVWCDITRMRTLNTNQGKAREEQHLCPLPFDIVNRLIIRYTNKGETVCDSFNGVGTVTYCCIPLERYGIGIDLSEVYHNTAVKYCKEAEYKRSVPTLFDLEETEKAS